MPVRVLLPIMVSNWHYHNSGPEKMRTGNNKIFFGWIWPLYIYFWVLWKNFSYINLSTLLYQGAKRIPSSHQISSDDIKISRINFTYTVRDMIATSRRADHRTAKGIKSNQKGYNFLYSKLLQSKKGVDSIKNDTFAEFLFLDFE